MIRSVFVAGTAAGVLALGGLTAAAGNSHLSSLTHLATNGSSTGEERVGALTALTQALRATATDAESVSAAHAQKQAEAQTPNQAQTQTQDEDTSESDDAAENDTAENDDAAEQAAATASAQQPAPESENEQAPTGGSDEAGGD